MYVILLSATTTICIYWIVQIVKKLRRKDNEF